MKGVLWLETQEDPTAETSKPDKFAKTHLNKSKSFWENVLWTDETKLELFGKAHHLYVYRKQNEAFKEKNTFPPVKHGGGSVMF